MLAAAVSSVSATFENPRELAKERDQLVAQNEELRAENERMRSQLKDMGALGEGAGVRAGVLARPPLSPYDTLVVALGQGAQVTVGDLVLGPGSVPVGRVAEATGATARITLFSSPSIETPGWVGEARLPVTLVGRGAGALAARVSREAQVAVGESVYVAGPGALPIGTVVSVDTDPSLPEAYIHIRPIINPFSLTWVRISEEPYAALTH